MRLDRIVCGLLTPEDVRLGNRFLFDKVCVGYESSLWHLLEVWLADPATHVLLRQVEMFVLVSNAFQDWDEVSTGRG